MRALAPWLAIVLLVPSAAAEFGRYDENGFPLSVDGVSTFPGGVVPGGAVPPDGPVNQAGPFTLYPYYPVLTAEVQRLAMRHPDLVKLHSAGKSTLGLDLWMLEIADFANPDMRPLESREVVWVDGGTHSNEYSGVYFVAHLASFLLDEYATNETARWIVENRHTFLMPMVNPDGSHAFGRLNAKGVNVNRNYPVDWGALAEDSVMNNPGPEPASEVETRINIEWFNKTRPDYYASIHCCGNLWLYPYGVQGLDPVDNQTLSRICEEAFPTVREDCGPIWSTIYPASGSSVDTVYEFTGAAAFGYEMSGRGAVLLWGQPITEQSVRVQEVESWTGVLHAFLHVERYGAYPNVTAARVVDGALEVVVTNDGYGNLTGGNVTVGGVTAGLPDLAPDASATVRLDAALAEGDLEVRVGYVKRLAAAPTGEVVGVLTLVRAADGSLQVSAVDGEVVPLGDPLQAPLPVGGLAPLVVVALAALVGFARRR